MLGAHLLAATYRYFCLVILSQCSIMVNFLKQYKLIAENLRNTRQVEMKENNMHIEWITVMLRFCPSDTVRDREGQVP